MSENLNESYFDSFAQDTSNNQQHNEQSQNEKNQESAGGNEPMSDDADLFDIKQRVKGMDEEAARLLQLQNEMEQQMKSTNSPTASKLKPTSPPNLTTTSNI